jgi:hypothetical protein
LEPEKIWLGRKNCRPALNISSGRAADQLICCTASSFCTMRTRLFIAILVILDCLRIAAQSSDTYLKTFDPNPSNMWVADKAANVWSIGSYIYVVNGYLNPNEDRIQQIFKINVNTREIVKQIGLTGPEIDLAIAEPAGYCLTADQHILLMNELLQNIKLIKMNAWEQKFGYRIKHNIFVSVFIKLFCIGI